MNSGYFFNKKCHLNSNCESKFILTILYVLFHTKKNLNTTPKKTGIREKIPNTN